jgi:hypothetical protein
MGNKPNEIIAKKSVNIGFPSINKLIQYHRPIHMSPFVHFLIYHYDVVREREKVYTAYLPAPATCVYCHLSPPVVHGISPALKIILTGKYLFFLKKKIG